MCTPEGWLPGATIVTGDATRGDRVEMWAAPDAVTTWVIPARRSQLKSSLLYCIFLAENI
jgi:hypothetical protein